MSTSPIEIAKHNLEVLQTLNSDIRSSTTDTQTFSRSSTEASLAELIGQVSKQTKGVETSIHEVVAKTKQEDSALVVQPEVIQVQLPAWARSQSAAQSLSKVGLFSHDKHSQTEDKQSHAENKHDDEYVPSAFGFGR